MAAGIFFVAMLVNIVTQAKHFVGLLHVGQGCARGLGGKHMLASTCFPLGFRGRFWLFSGAPWRRWVVIGWEVRVASVSGVSRASLQILPLCWGGRGLLGRAGLWSGLGSAQGSQESCYFSLLVKTRIGDLRRLPNSSPCTAFASTDRAVNASMYVCLHE